MINVSCENTPVSVQVGTNNNQYVYRYGYIWRNNAWQRVDFSGNTPVYDNVWFQGNAGASINLTTTELATKNNLIAYVCTWTGSEWKCGCRDSSCTTPYWQIMQFGKY